MIAQQLCGHAVTKEVSKWEMKNYSRYQRARKIKKGEEQSKEVKIREIKSFVMWTLPIIVCR